MLSRANERLGRLKEAGALRRACAIEEENGDITLWRALELLARCQQQCGDATAARAAGEKALSLVPEGADEIVYAGLRQLIADFGAPAPSVLPAIDDHTRGRR